MDDINNDFEKYYNFAQQQNQQNLSQQQQHHIAQQQHITQQQLINQQQQQQHHIGQQQPIGQQQIHQQGRQHINLEDSQHGHSAHEGYDHQDLLDLVTNDFYSSAQFASNEDSSSDILLNSQYKPQNDDQSIFLDQIDTGSVPKQINSGSLSTSIPTYMPSSQPFSLEDSLTIEQIQQRRNSELAFNHNHNLNHHNHNHNNHSNNNNSNNNNNNINNNEHNYIFLEQQQQLLLNEANAILAPFEHSQTSLAPSSAHSNFQSKPRQEQDVFCELISLATKNNAMGQHNMDSWQNHANHNFVQGVPHSFSSTEFSSDVQLQIENQHLLQHKQNSNKQDYSNPSSITPAQFSKGKTKAEASASNTTPGKLDESNNATTYNERIYKLSIAQQPSRARMCGFGDKDRRPISPPPIVQLVVSTKDGQIINPETFDASFLVVICDSCQQIDPIDGDPEFSMYENPLSQVISYPTTTTDDGEASPNSAIKMRNLVGSSVSSATKLYDLDGNFGIFFIFQDVSLRTEGCFRLKFSLIDVGSPYSNTVNTTSVSHVLEVIYTEPFMVYTAKKFPGVVQSTPLSKCFARQGIKIPIRKEKSASTKKSQANQTSESAEKSDDEN